MIIKVKSKTKGVRMVETKSFDTFADLPKNPAGGQIEHVKNTTGVVGMKKYAGFWQWDVNAMGLYGWKLIAKD